MPVATVPLRLRTIVVLLLAALALAACVREDQVAPVEGAEGEGDAAAADGAGGGRLSIATGGTSGVYFVYGGGLAEQVTANLEGYEATAEATSASVDNLFLVADGSSDLAFTLADTAAEAVAGEGPFDEPIEAQALGNLYDNVNHLVTTADSGIASVADLQGRRVSIGSPNSGTEVTALRVLDAAGIDPESDIEPLGLGVEESVQAVRDGTADAFFWSGGLPTGGVTDLASTDEIVIVPLDEELGALQETFGDVYKESMVPAETYPGVTEDVPTIGVANYLVVSPDMDEQVAYDLTQLLFDQQEALTQVHPEAGNLTMERAPDVAPMELHPGAQRYYEEQASG